MKEETGTDDIEKGIAGDSSSVGGSEAAILGNEEEQYTLDPREHWRRMSTAMEKLGMRGARIATPDNYGGRVSRVST
jgi:hypothetical protein